MKKNYKAWEINIGGYYKKKSALERVQCIAEFGILAPSSHNSQSWKFSLANNSIEIFADMRRSLSASDKNNRQLFISLGCAAENIQVAADYYGFRSFIEYFPQGMRIRLEGMAKQNPTKDHLIFSIPKRCTNRNPYIERMPDKTFLDLIQKLATPEMRIDCILDKRQKDKIADVVIAAGIAAMEDKGFRKELSEYVKPNITNSPKGMPCFGFGIPTPVSFVAPFMMRFLNMNRITKVQDAKLLKKQTPLFLLISTRSDSFQAWMKVGQLYERIALEAQRRGISVAPMAAAIQIGEFYKDLQRILNLSFRPQFFLRMGYSNKETVHSPRILLHEVNGRRHS